MRHLLLSGGPGHDFDGTSALVAGSLEQVGAATTVIRDPHAAIAALRDSWDGHRSGWDLLTVNALRWRMDSARHAQQRDRWAVALDPADLEVVERHVLAGGGLLALHTAVICFDGQPTWRRLVGAAWDWNRSDHPPVGPLEVTPTTSGQEHPVTSGTAAFTVVDELYQHLDLEPDVDALLTGTQQGSSHPVLWARSQGGGRVVTSLLGHGQESLAHPAHRELIARAGAWAARVPATAGGPPT